MVGFCSVDVKPFGPVQAYVAPATVVAFSAPAPPPQYGPVFDATGAAGLALTTTFVVPAAEVQPLTVTVTEYGPASATAALNRVGVRTEAVKPFGPVHEYVAPATAGGESEMFEPLQYGTPVDAAPGGGTPLGRARESAARAAAGVESEMFEPLQYGPPFDAAGVAGMALTTTFVVPAGEGQPLTVTAPGYGPAVG